MTVNSYLIWNPETKEAIAFDTGADADPLFSTLQKEGLTLKLLLLTHGHGDHILELDRILEKTGAEAWISSAEAVHGTRTFHPGHSFQCGGIMIFTRLTCGHSPGGITYVISPFNRQLAVVGDALFARSMGGGMVSYADALRTNREEIFTLLDDTILAPGHGPLTTVAEEKKYNPFYPEFK
jgi:glyoxylase-like metal-dependent hydrolase (beta-lactamase superfamily II)